MEEPMKLEEIRARVEASTSTTLMAWRFREALGVRQIAPKPKKADEVPGERYERLMRQRYGALDRVR